MSAKQRVRGPSVLERQRDEEKQAALRVELAWPSRKPASAKAVLQSETAASGGKSIKTGMLLARAQLSDGRVGGTVARGREGVRNTSGITWMSPPGATGGSGEARGVPHLGPAPLE